MKIEIDVDDDGEADLLLDVPSGAKVKRFLIIAVAAFTSLCAGFGGASL